MPMLTYANTRKFVLCFCFLAFVYLSIIKSIEVKLKKTKITDFSHAGIISFSFHGRIF